MACKWCKRIAWLSCSCWHLTWSRITSVSLLCVDSKRWTICLYFTTRRDFSILRFLSTVARSLMSCHAWSCSLDRFVLGFRWPRQFLWREQHDDGSNIRDSICIQPAIVCHIISRCLVVLCKVEVCLTLCLWPCFQAYLIDLKDDMRSQVSKTQGITKQKAVWL